MKVKFDPLLHIDNLVKQIKTTIHITGSSSNPYTAAKYLSTAYNLIHQIGVYKDMWKEWRNKNETDKTWPNFKLHFAKAYIEILEDNTANHNKIHLFNFLAPTKDYLHIPVYIYHLQCSPVCWLWGKVLVVVCVWKREKMCHCWREGAWRYFRSGING